MKGYLWFPYDGIKSDLYATDETSQRLGQIEMHEKNLGKTLNNSDLNFGNRASLQELAFAQFCQAWATSRFLSCRSNVAAILHLIPVLE